MKFRLGKKRISSLNSFDAILPDIIQEYELEKSFTIQELVTKWSFIVGDIISTHSKPDRLHKKLLIVSVDHSIYAHEIVVMKDIIIQKIHNELPYLSINDIRTEIKKIRW